MNRQRNLCLKQRRQKELLNFLRTVSKLASLSNISTYLKETSMEMFLSIQRASNLANPPYVSQIEATKNRHSNGSQNPNSAPSVPKAATKLTRKLNPAISNYPQLESWITPLIRSQTPTIYRQNNLTRYARFQQVL
jgi:hypothetical protein